MADSQCQALDYTDFLGRCRLVAGHDCPHAVKCSRSPSGSYWWLRHDVNASAPVVGPPDSDKGETWPWHPSAVSR